MTESGSDAFRALADPTRREILELLRRRSRPVRQIAERFPVSRPAISRHLRLLREAGLVTETRAGRQRIYEALPEGLEPVGEWLATLEELEGQESGAGATRAAADESRAARSPSGQPQAAPRRPRGAQRTRFQKGAGAETRTTPATESAPETAGTSRTGTSRIGTRTTPAARETAPERAGTTTGSTTTGTAPETAGTSRGSAEARTTQATESAPETAGTSQRPPETAGTSTEAIRDEEDWSVW